jgi:hypothetical protein
MPFNVCTVREPIVEMDCDCFLFVDEIIDRTALDTHWKTFVMVFIH